MEPLKGVFKNVTGFVGRMTPSQVMMLFGVVAGTIVGIVLLVGWVKDITYSRLYSDLDEAEAGEIINYLNDNKIPYKLADNGRVDRNPLGPRLQDPHFAGLRGDPQGGQHRLFHLR